MPNYRDPDEPKIYFLPNLMTAGNLACGFFAVLMIFFGMIEDAMIGFEAGWLIAQADEMPAWNQGDEFEAARKKAIAAR